MKFNTDLKQQPASLSLKPDLAEAAHRWEAFYAGEIIDRPVVCVTAPGDGRAPVPEITRLAQLGTSRDYICLANRSPRASGAV
jgi:hypothetical protein